MTNETIIKRGKKILENDNHGDEFESFGMVYPSTTENVRGTYEHFELSGKDILTVTSSGDHILCAALAGAKNIDSFDVNVLTEYFYYLKKAFIESYDLKDFEKVFCKFVRGDIDFSDYNKIRAKLDGKYQEFWDEVIYYALNNNFSLNRLFIANEKGFRLRSFDVNYLGLEEYGRLKELLPTLNTKFIHSDLNSLGGKLTDSYDYMFLSNISDYIGLFKTRKLALKKLMPHVNDGGEIIYAYMYDATENMARRYDESYYPIYYADGKGKDFVLSLKKSSK